MYKINSFITNNSLEKLRKLKNTPCSLWVDYLGSSNLVNGVNFTMGMIGLIIKNETKEYIIKSVPEIKGDGEETPRLIVFDYNNKDNNKWVSIVSQKIVKSILIIKDHMILEDEGNIRDEKIDVGIKIIFKDSSTFVIMSTFSGVGLFEVWYANKLFDIKKKGEDILDHWGIGFRNVDEYINLERSERRLF